MKYLRLSLLLGICLGLIGCASTTKTKWMGGGAVHTDYVVVSDRAYTITARGAQVVSEENVVRAWLWRAKELAAGRQYEVTYETRRYDYTAPGPQFATRHSGYMAEGALRITEAQPGAVGNEGHRGAD